MKIAEKEPVTKKTAIIKKDENGVLCAYCPTCGKKATPLHSYTVCYKFPWKCKNTKCTEKEFEISYSKKMCLI
jgi:hypothetical protein